MKKASPFIIAAILFLITCVGAGQYNRRNIYEKKELLIYHNTDSRNSCKTALEWVMEGNSIPVFGSSELSAADDVAYPPVLFKNGNADFNMDGERIYAEPSPCGYSWRNGGCDSGEKGGADFVSAVVYSFSSKFGELCRQIFREDVQQVFA